VKLEQLLKSLEQGEHAPTERWNPPYCGELPMHIDANGQWLYQNSAIKRHELVKLFARVLVFENNDYFLVTPAEKVKISVADAPFIVTTWQQITRDAMSFFQLTTNVGQQFALSAEHGLVLKNQKIYAHCGRNLLAKVHRNVVYQWADIAQVKKQHGRDIYYIENAGQQFDLNT